MDVPNSCNDTTVNTCINCQQEDIKFDKIEIDLAQKKQGAAVHSMMRVYKRCAKRNGKARKAKRFRKENRSTVNSLVISAWMTLWNHIPNITNVCANSCTNVSYFNDLLFIELNAAQVNTIAFDLVQEVTQHCLAVPNKITNLLNRQSGLFTFVVDELEEIPTYKSVCS